MANSKEPTYMADNNQNPSRAQSRSESRRAYLAAEREEKKASRWAVLSRIIGVDITPTGGSV